jgi:hypothetical protein
MRTEIFYQKKPKKAELLGDNTDFFGRRPDFLFLG